MAQRLSLHPEQPQVRHLRAITESLRSGGLIVYPTDTIYGLGCDLFNKKSIDLLYQIKQETTDKPMSFVCADLEDLARYAKNISNASYRLMKRLLPGPYTFILEASRDVPRFMIRKRKTVGIRVPDHEVCLAIVREFGHPLISTSVTLPDGDILNDPVVIENYFGKVVNIIVDAGILISEPSTVIDLTGDAPVVVRSGKGSVDF
jgi:tRNA threonylcarbamoyl adenosine modification protein (Sua5/YciO/YrdC/YwlC family)